MLKVTYDGLSEIDQKIFLDIACFFKGEKKDRVTRILDSFDFHAHFGIKRLVQRSLIYVSNSRIHMHDRIQEMGWDIVRKRAEKPGECSRLWLPQDIFHVLTMNTGTTAVEGISLSPSSCLTTFEFDTRSFKKMSRLRLLVLNDKPVPSKLGWLSEVSKYIRSMLRSSIELECLSNLRWLTWEGFILDSLPDFLGTSKLVGLEIPCSRIVQLWEEGEVPNGRKSLNQLRFINLCNSCWLQQTPNLNLTPNLQILNLDWCSSLVDVHPSIGDHGQLVFLSLKYCYKLQSLPSSIEMKSLETLILSRCAKLTRFPDIKGNMKRLSELHLDGTSIEELPASVGNLPGLVLMDLTSCTSLKSLPGTICELKCLKTLYLSNCVKLDKLPENLGQIKTLEELWLDGTQIREAPSSMRLLKNLKTFAVKGCKELMSSMLSKLCPNSSMFCLEQPLLLSFCCIKSLFLDFCDLSDGDIPADLSLLSSLEELNLSGNLFKYLPEGICHHPRLKILNVTGCQNLEAFESHLPSGIAVLKADWTVKSTSFPDLSTKYDSLWKISYYTDYVPAEQLTTSIMKSLLQGLLVANHRFSLVVRGCHIPEWFMEKRPENHPSLQYKEDILGFAICNVFSDFGYSVFIDIQFDLIEESSLKYIPQASTYESSHSCKYHYVWVGFISFSFFKLLFPEIQLDNWSTFTSTIRASIYDKDGFKCKHVAIRPVYKEDVERVPTTREAAHYDTLGRPWLQYYVTEEDHDYITGTDSSRRHPFSSTTAYLKER